MSDYDAYDLLYESRMVRAEVLAFGLLWMFMSALGLLVMLARWTA